MLQSKKQEEEALISEIKSILVSLGEQVKSAKVKEILGASNENSGNILSVVK